MSDILIRGMKMSENCEDCQLATVGSFGTFCPLKKCSIKKGYSFKYCPLVEIPEKHGRIVDLDRVLDWLVNEKRFFSMGMSANVAKALADAPVILKADM